MIRNILSELTDIIKSRQRDIFLTVCMVLVAGIGYNLGRTDTLNQPADKKTGEVAVYGPASLPAIKNSTTKYTYTPAPARTPTDMRVVASKKSKSKTYHYTWCGGAKQIKDENKLWFDTAEAAQTAGYTLAGNCK